MPNEDNLHVKGMYSFKAFGEPKRTRNNSDMFATTYRSTMQTDSPFFRGRLEPYNTKHGIVDPAHTFTHSPTHHTRRDIDFTRVNLKNPDD